MRKFNFNLERLLRIREHEERDWEIKLGKAVSECVQIRNGIANRKSEIDRVLITRGNLEERQADFFTMEIYKRRMNDEIRKLEKELVDAEARKEEVRSVFLEVSKNRKVLSKLKEKREAEYYKEQQKIEFNIVDEINNGRAAGRAMI